MSAIEKKTITITSYHGHDTLPWVQTIAEMRLQEFQHYPYLYAGNFNIEEKYLTSYTNDPHSTFVIAEHENQVVGILTGAPLASPIEPVSGATLIFNQHRLNAADYYYYGEFIVLPDFRNQGITKRLFQAQTDYLKKIGFKNACLMTVEPSKHAQAPTEYFNTETVWEKFGFTKTSIKIEQTWPTLQSDQTVKDEKHCLAFWEKPIF